MGYKNFSFGDKLNPEDFNTKFEKVFELVKKAYMHNNQLRARLEVLNTAFSHANTKITAGADPYAETENFYRNNAGAANNQEVVLGGQLFTESYSIADVNLESGSNLVYEGQLMLDYGSESVSRIPLTENKYGESSPSLGVEFTANNSLLDADKLWMILSSEAIWADHIASPDTGTPANNTIE